ncbi:hypothetical protein BK654_05975 [Pseudomonas brassicacearum]|nr:hypothetical protein BK654_05975 [Pseudomonas brassicacearum]
MMLLLIKSQHKDLGQGFAEVGEQGLVVDVFYDGGEQGDSWAQVSRPVTYPNRRARRRYAHSHDRVQAMPD